MNKRWGLTAMVGVMVALLGSASAAGVARVRHHRRAATVRPRVLVGLGSSSAGALPLQGQVVTGATDVWVVAKGARRAIVTLDPRSAGDRRRTVLSVRRGRLRPWVLDTTQLADGAHVVAVKLTLKARRQVTARASFRVDNKGASTDQLVAEALAQHRIDLGTSLLDRFYAFTGDPRLPASLHGTPPADDDVAIDAATALANGQVTGAEAAKLRRYLLRPSDPHSAYYKAARRQARIATAPAGGRCASGPEIGSGDARAWGWESRSDIAKFGNAYRLIRGFASDGLAAEEADMGPLWPDQPTDCEHGNPTSALDVYLVDGPAATSIRSQYTTNSNLAVTVPQCSAGHCTAFILMDARFLALGADQVRSTLYHEIFHALEDSHMASYANLNNWFLEASAVWAQQHYLPDNSWSISYANGWYAEYQQQRFYSLGSECRTCRESYDSWIWPFFMTQEGSSVPAAWASVGTATDNASATRALNARFPFATHFRDFAVRDANVAYHEQGSTQPGPYFQTGPRGWGKLGLYSPERLAGENDLQDTNGSQSSVAMYMPGSLDFSAKHFAFPDKNTDPKVALDFSNAGSDADIDLLVHVVGHPDYEHRRLSGTTFSICRDNPADNIDQLIAIVSNHSLEGEGRRSGLVQYTTTRSCGAPARWSGTVTENVTNSDGTNVDLHWTLQASMTFTLNPSSAGDQLWEYTPTAGTLHASVDGTSYGCRLTGSGDIPIDGHGDPRWNYMDIWPQPPDPRYQFSVSEGAITATLSDPPGTSNGCTGTETMSPPRLQSDWLNLQSGPDERPTYSGGSSLSGHWQSTQGTFTYDNAWNLTAG